MPLAWDLPNAAWAMVYGASAAGFAWLLWLGMKNHGSAERGTKRVLKQVAALGAVAVVAMLAFVAAARAQVLAPRRNFDERILVAAASVREGCALPSRFRDALARKWDGRCAPRPRTARNGAECVDWHGACSAPHTAEGEPR